MKDVIKLEHGGGGRLMRELVEEVIIPAYRRNRVEGGIGLPEMDDGATIPIDGCNIVFTTDAYTVRPLFFPGGDIGRLAICGTVNDLAVMGAAPLALATSIVLEEGLPIEVLRRVVDSMNRSLEEVGVPLIAGDTKVVEHGELDKLMINASGVGLAERVVTDGGLRPGDRIIFTGTIGNHQLSLLSIREGLQFEAPLESDVAPLWDMIREVLRVGGVTAMKDPTRGGVAGALNDMARKSGVDILLWEEEIPIRGVVRSAAEMLGLDPLELANEGVAIIGVEREKAQEVLEAVRRDRYGRDAAIVGEVLEGKGRVILETLVGGRRVVREPLGSPMPRIC
ncbi:hydrogenase expression/formation protein HypE [Candidatus Bathyarchaeota archaeon]|nr:MAG: hydrogenase expression/formation protein HypE [Candidatus Bathyarchaeota archaeon]